MIKYTRKIGRASRVAAETELSVAYEEHKLRRVPKAWHFALVPAEGAPIGSTAWSESIALDPFAVADGQGVTSFCGESGAGLSVYSTAACGRTLQAIKATPGFYVYRMPGKRLLAVGQADAVETLEEKLLNLAK